MSARKTVSRHLDKTVVYFFVAMFLVSASGLAYRFVRHAPCNEVAFTKEANEFRVGQMITFKDRSIGAESWKWDFGDSTEINNQKDPFHIFEKPGEYEVRLLVNNICEKTEVVTIDEKRVFIDSTKFPIFKLPKTIRVGQKLRVKDETENASTWEWRFGETAGSNATTRRAEYVYEEPGLKTVSLIVNGDENYIRKKKINVLSVSGISSRRPVIEEFRPSRGNDINLRREVNGSNGEDGDGTEGTGAVEIEKAPEISNRNFRTKLLTLSNEKTNVQAFSDYLCGNLNIPMVSNGKNMTFLQFTEKIKGKKIRIRDLNLIKNPDTNCITNITIQYKRNSIF